MPVGTTSACAENKLLRIFPPPPGRNYLRVRGEYKPPAEDRAWHPELPPRARRIPPIQGKGKRLHGTTSACAENTWGTPTNSHKHWNYLRVRGEYAWDAIAAGINWELPPRARRIRVFQPHNEGWTGTTSACAENTAPPRWRKSPLGNYLRVRGEY